MDLKEHLDSLWQNGACVQVLDGDTVLPLGGFLIEEGSIRYATPFPESQQDVHQVGFDAWESGLAYLLFSAQGEPVAGVAAASMWAEVDLHEFVRVDAAWKSFLQTPGNLKEFMDFLRNA